MNRKKKITGTIDDYPLVIIKWFDCLATNEWMSTTKARRLEPAIGYSIGYKLIETKDKTTIFADYSEDLEEEGIEVGNLNTIPAAWIQDITEIVIKWNILLYFFSSPGLPLLFILKLFPKPSQMNLNNFV